MIIRKAFKYRLKTTSQLEQQFRQYAGCCRFVWNKALGIQKQRLNDKEYAFKYAELTANLTQWKKDPDLLWLKAAPSQNLQQTLKDLDRAMKDAFDKKNPKRFPQFKKRGVRDSFRFPQGFRIEGNRIFLPKIGHVSFYNSRKLIGIPKNATVSQRAGKWYVSVQVEIEVPEIQSQHSSALGIDMGINKLITCSDGNWFAPLRSLKVNLNKLARLQRQLSRKEKGSSNWHKQKLKVSRLHATIADCRSDYLHKISHYLSKNHAVIVIEALQVKNMSRSAKGTAEQPGTNVKAKSGLNRSILDMSWGEFARQLEYKTVWNGAELIKVPPQHTSQMCSKCHHVSAKNRTTQAHFKCDSCGHEANADFNASINVFNKAAGHVVSACGVLALADTMKQEPLDITAALAA